MASLLSVILGMLLIYLIFAIAVSHLRESIAQRLSDRGRFLREGVYRLIGDDAISARVLHHALINSLYRDPKTRTAAPSYIEPANFALALSHIIVRRGAPPTVASAEPTDAAPPQETAAKITYESLRTALTRFADQRSQLAVALLPIVDAAGDLDKALKGIEGWFSGGMDRVSGWYKAHARGQLFWLGFLLAIALNIDSIQLFHHLNRSPEEAAKLVAVTEQLERTGKLGSTDIQALKARPANDEELKSLISMIEDRTTLGTLPIGYACLGFAKEQATPPTSGGAPSSAWSTCQKEVASLGQLGAEQWFLKILGWTLTAFAGSLGAAYWFAAISKVLNVRGTGPRPSSAKSK